MGDTEEYYYKLTIYLLSIIGLWPGESMILQRIHKVRCSIMMVISLISQLTPFITTQCSTTVILHNVPVIIVATGSVLKYFSFLFQSDDVKKLTELVKYDWSTTKDDEELKILMRHANVGKSYTIVFARFLYPSLFLCMLSLYGPWFLDLVAPLNETRSLQFFVTFELFVDQQKYFHIFALAFSMVCFTVGTVYLATESVYMMWLLHQASQFEIYAYRLRKAFLGDSVEMHVLNRNARITKIFASALDMYDRAILFNVCLGKFCWSYFILLGFGVTSLSVFMYRLSEALKTLDNLDELLLCLILIIAEFAYMFYINYMMQRKEDAYDNVLTATYDTNWYAAPARAQKMLLLVMLRNIQPITKRLYGMYDPSMGGFVVLAKMTLSYFMMMHSMQ